MNPLSTPSEARCRHTHLLHRPHRRRRNLQLHQAERLRVHSLRADVRQPGAPRLLHGVRDIVAVALRLAVEEALLGTHKRLRDGLHIESNAGAHVGQRRRAGRRR